MGNQQGKERRDFGRKIDWNNAGPPSPPGKPFLVPAENDRPTDVITIRWSPPATDGGAPVVGYLVEHRRTGSPHWLRATPDLVPGTKLPLTGLEPGWRYQFRVSAENGAGRSEPGDLSEPLTVTPQKWAASAPFFNVELQDTIGLENEKVEFKVQVVAVPPPTIAWYKDGFEVFSSRRTKIVTENDQSTFIIHQAALEDEGEIKCTATNRAGYAVTKANLKLEAPPRLRLPRQYEDGLIFEKGELIRLKVTTAGRPRPQVHWYHNGDLLEKKGRAEVVDLESGSLIRISDACRGDRGEYMIKGVNRIGEDVVSFLVTVTDRPSPPGKVQISMFGRMITLCWSEPEDDGGCKIGSYIVEYFRVGWEMWLKAKNSRQLSTILEDLIEGSEYKFRVRAENPYGVSEPSEESDVIFIPDPKRGIFKPPPKEETSAILKETKKLSENNAETEEGERRRELEEKARRLLDTPLPFLLNANQSGRTAESVESMNDESVPPPVPKRRRTKGRLTHSPVDGSSSDSQRMSPSPVEGLINKARLTPSPVLNKTYKADEVTNGTVQKPYWKFEGENRQEKIAIKFMEQDVFSGEGPLYPRENDDSIMHGSSELMLVIYPRDRSKSVELNAQQRSEIEMSLAADGVAPPMSLSAPELGCTEIFEQPLMRDAISSTELLYERTAARLYQDSVDEEAQRMLRRRYSMDRKSVERRASLKEPLEKRFSFKGDLEDRQRSEPVRNTLPSEEPSANDHAKEEFQSKIPKPLNKTTRERLNSVERERLEFALVRDRLKRKEEENPQSRLGVIHHESETSTTTPTSSSADLQDLDEDYDDEDVEEEEDYLEKKEKQMEEDFDDGISSIKNELSRMSTIDTRLTLPKSNRIVPFTEREEDTYHPRSMIPTRSVITKLPTEDIKTIMEPPMPPLEVPRPSSPSQPEVKPEPSKTKIPIPSKSKKTSKILKKLRLKREKKIPEVKLTPADQDSPPAVLPKPILKNKIPANKKDSPKTLLKVSLSKTIDKSVSEEESESELAGRKKKQVRIAEPNEEVEKNQVETTVDKNARENQVLIYHYSDIVREFGGNKKAPVKLFLNYEELKAHAKEFEKVNSLPTQSEFLSEGTGASIKNERTPEAAVALEASSTPPEIGQAEVKIHASLEYIIDVIMFIVACCLYLFKNELYAIPILAIMVYRQLKDMTLEKYEKVKDSLANYIPNKFKGKAGNEEVRH